MQIDETGKAKKEYIYALADPVTEDPFYLGRSVRIDVPDGAYHVPVDPGTSVGEKVSEKILQIARHNRVPLFVILEETTDGEQSHREWLDHWASIGCQLVNEMPIPEKAKTKRLTIDIDADLHRKLKERAFKEHTSVADLARKQFQELAQQHTDRKAS